MITSTLFVACKHGLQINRTLRMRKAVEPTQTGVVSNARTHNKVSRSLTWHLELPANLPPTGLRTLARFARQKTPTAVNVQPPWRSTPLHDARLKRTAAVEAASSNRLPQQSPRRVERQSGCERFRVSLRGAGKLFALLRG